MWRIEHDKVERSAFKRQVGKRTLDVWVDDKMPVLLLSGYRQRPAEVALPFFLPDVTVGRVRFVFLKPDCPVAASRV